MQLLICSPSFELCSLHILTIHVYYESKKEINGYILVHIFAIYWPLFAKGHSTVNFW